MADVSATDTVPANHRPVTRDELELVLRGLLVPSPELVHRMAYQLYAIATAGKSVAAS